MMTADGQADILRLRMAEQIDGLPDDGDGGSSSPSLVCVTVTVSTYPTAAGKFYGVQAVDPGGTESEGSTVSYGTAGGTFYAANVGTAIPAVGTHVIATLIGGRWVFRF